MTSRLRWIAWTNLAIALTIGASIFGLAVVTVNLVDAVVSIPRGIFAGLSNLDFSGLAGPLFAIDLQQRAQERGVSPRDPALIDQALQASATSDLARLPDGVLARGASRAEWAKNRWRVEFARKDGFECVTVPAYPSAQPEIHDGRCGPNLAK